MSGSGLAVAWLGFLPCSVKQHDTQPHKVPILIGLEVNERNEVKRNQLF